MLLEFLEKSLNFTRTDLYEPCENQILLQMNNQGADQPAHPHSRISAFIIFLESIITTLAPIMSVIWLVSVAVQTGLSLACSETQKTGFLMMRSIGSQKIKELLGKKKYRIVSQAIFFFLKKKQMRQDRFLFFIYFFQQNRCGNFFFLKLATLFFF